MAGPLAGKRILVVEDEYFIASDLKRALEKEGAVVAGPVGELPQGLALLSTDVIDAAILDVNLEGATSFPIADRLAEHGVPFIFLTGYDGWAIPDAYRDMPRIGKPFPIRAVIDCMTRLLGAEIDA